MPDPHPVPLSLSRPSIERGLSGFEKLFWLYDQITPFHFALAARVSGIGRTIDWEAALARLQQRHALFRVALKSEEQSLVLSDAKVSLRIVSGQSGDIGGIIAAELAEPISVSLDQPLVRAIVHEYGTTTDLILVAHHAVADGLSLAFALRDWVHLASGFSLPTLPTPLSQEEAIGLDVAQPRTTDHHARPPRRPVPYVECAAIPRTDMAALKQACRAEGTTIHGALCAALELAGRDHGGWNDRPVTVLSPVSTRHLGGEADDVRLAIVVSARTAPPNRLPFWDCARAWRDGAIEGLRTAPAALAVVGAFMASDPSAHDVASLMADKFTSNGMVTNLGELGIETSHRDLTITALYGPAILTGTPGEQVIGALSLDSQLFLTLTSDDPMEKLLRRLIKLLNTAVRS